MKISTIGFDLAKSVFAVHGIGEAGEIGIRRSLRRGQVLAFFAKLDPCLVGMEASSGAHYWARELTKLGHAVKLMPASYVKAYVKRGKTDAGDAEAICEAVRRPTMRFVAVKSREAQGLLSLHRARQLLVRQRTQTVNVLRGLCGEFGVVAAKGKTSLSYLAALIGDEGDDRLPPETRLALKPLVMQLEHLARGIAQLEREIVRHARADQAARRLESIPGVGPLTAGAFIASIGDVTRFASGRDLAAFIGLTPQPHSSGGKHRLSGISKQGNPYLRQLLVQGASAVMRVARHSASPAFAWLKALLARRPPKVAVVALANKMARIVWALLAKGGVYRVQPA
jgi:transposase